MTAPAITLAKLRQLDPCPTAMDRLENRLPKRRKITAAQARECGASFSDIIWVASALAVTDKDVERRLRMWMADCAARVLVMFERDYPSDNRPRNAIQAARQYACGEISATARGAARAAAEAAAWDAVLAAEEAWDAAEAAAEAAAWDAARAAEEAWDAAEAAVWAAARAAAGIAARAAARAAAGIAEEAWQFDRLIAWLSESEPEPLEIRANEEMAA